MPGRIWDRSDSREGCKAAAGARAVLGQVWAAEHVQAVTKLELSEDWANAVNEPPEGQQAAVSF